MRTRTTKPQLGLVTLDTRNPELASWIEGLLPEDIRPGTKDTLFARVRKIINAIVLLRDPTGFEQAVSQLLTSALLLA